MRPLVPLLVLACRPAVGAPDDIEDQVVFGFVHFHDAGHVEAVGDSLVQFVTEPPPELEEGFFVDELDADDLALVDVADPDVEGVIGALGRSVYQLDPTALAAAITAPDRAERLDNTDRFDVVEELGDRDCFLARACDAYTYVVEEETRVPVLGRTTRVFTGELRWLTTDAGAQVLSQRVLGPDPVDVASALLAIDQQYGFSVISPHEGGSIRAEAIWVEARIVGAELPEGFAVRQAVQQMQATADALDAAFGD